jgi:hypothetical protein
MVRVTGVVTSVASPDEPAEESPSEQTVDQATSTS